LKTVPTLHIANGRLYGGIERMLATLAECGKARFEFAVAAEGRLLTELRGRGAQVHFLGDVRLRSPSSILRARHLLRSILRTRQPTSVVCHAPWSHALFAGVPRNGGVPTVLWQHDRATGGSLVERACRAAGADLVICNSHWTARTAVVLQPDAPCRVIYCPVMSTAVSADVRVRTRAAMGVSTEHVVVLAASRLEPWKGHPDLIRALSRLGARPWVLWIAGGAQRPHERAYVAEIEAEVRRLGVESRVRFLGERQDVPELLAGADVLAQANVEPEPFGVIFAEALLAGVPVVTTNLGGAPEIVSSSCGRLVAPEDVNLFTEALDELIADARLRATLGAAGPAHATSRCDPSLVLPQIDQALSSIGVTTAA
jgi:glycosyltransferase involved in cell wall biosynthesis